MTQAMGMHIGKGILSTAASAWTRQIATLLLYVVAARVLTPDQIGIFALANAIILIFEYSVYDSISESVVQRANLSPGHFGAATFLSMMLAALIVIGAYLTSGLLGRTFGAPEISFYLLLMAPPVALLCVSSSWAGSLRRAARFDTIAKLAAFAAITAVGVGTALLLAGMGLVSLIAYFATEKIILTIGTIWLARTEPIRRFTLHELRALLPYAAAISVQRAAFYARGQADRLIIGMVWGTSVLGAYQIAARIFDSLQAALLTPISKLFFVSYTRSQLDPTVLREIFGRSLRAATLIVFPAFLGISAVAHETITLLFGPQWDSTAIIIQVMGFGGVALTLSVMSGGVLSAVGRARAFLAVELLSALVGILLLIVLSPFGIVWMAATFVLRETFAVAIYAYLLRTLLGLRFVDYLAYFVPALAASCIMWLALVLLDGSLLAGLPHEISLLAKIVIGAVSYGGLMFVFCRPLLIDTLRLLGHSSGQRRETEV
jgi:O-antigen/teichoic acid export membrane protein